MTQPQEAAAAQSLCKARYEFASGLPAQIGSGPNSNRISCIRQGDHLVVEAAPQWH